MIVAVTLILLEMLWMLMGDALDMMTVMKAVDGPDLVCAHKWESFQARSLTTCASMVSQKGGLAFTYQDMTCNMTGMGMNNASEHCTYKLFEIPVPSEDIIEGAHQKPGEATTEHADLVYEYSVDGDLNTMYHSTGSKAWWVVDLQANATVFEVTVHTRQSPSHSYRFHDVEVRVSLNPRDGSNFSSWTLMGFYKGPYQYNTGPVKFTSDSGICGRYVSIKKISDDTDALQLNEVLVYMKHP